MTQNVHTVSDFLTKLAAIKKDFFQEFFAEYVSRLKERNQYQKDNESEYTTQAKQLFDKRLFAYRGHNVYSWKLEPSLYRKHNQKYISSEHHLINDAIINYPNDFTHHETNFEKLAFLQHYQIPTRLLDLTENPLVALYFACSGNNTTQNASVNILSIDDSLVKYNNSDSVTILSAFSRIPTEKLKPIINQFKENIQIESCAEIKNISVNHKAQNLKQSLFDTFSNRYINVTENTLSYINHALNECDNIGYLLHEIRYEKPHFKPVISLEDYDNRILCVKTKMSNPRILAQQGLFLLFGIKSSDKSKIPQIDRAKFKNTIHEKKIIIDKTVKANILKELKALGISDARLFPEFSHSGKTILEKYS